MHIAFLAQPFDRLDPPVTGGSLSLWIYYMAGLCAQRGCKTVVFANHGNQFSERRTTHNGVNYVFTPTAYDRLLTRISAAANKMPPAGRNRVQPAFASPWHHRGYAAAAARRAKQLGCDVVHIMNYSQFVPIVRAVHERAVICLHMQCEWLTQLDQTLIRPRLEQADLIVGCSDYIASKIATKFPAHASRCVAVPNAAEAAPARSEPPKGQLVLFVGRLSPEKGLHHLIRAFRSVLQRFPDARLSLVGGTGSAPLEYLVGLSDEPHVAALREFYRTPGRDGKDPYLQALENEAGEELDRRIFFEGRVNHDELEDYYRRAALVVNPSLSESFGISLVEAMMRQIPVVATRVGGMTGSVDHGETGLLVEPADPTALGEAMCEILSDPERARRMGEAGRTKAIGKFSWDRTADLLLSHFQATLE